MFKLLWNLIKVLFVTAVLAIIFQQYTGRVVLALLLRADLGVPVEVEHAQIDFLKGEAHFQDIQIWNPEGFPPEVMVYIREISADTEISRLFQNGGLHFDRLEIDIDNVRIARQADAVNLFELRLFQKPDGFSLLKKMHMNELVLSIGRAGIHAGGKAGEAFSKEVGLRRMTYHKVTSLRDIFDIADWEVLKALQLEPLGRGYLDQISRDLDGVNLNPAEKKLSPPKAADWR